MSNVPKRGDSDVVLLMKIVATLSASNGGQIPPRRGDSKNTLLRKWAQHFYLYGL